MCCSRERVLGLIQRANTWGGGGKEEKSDLDGTEIGEPELEALAEAVRRAVPVQLEHPLAVGGPKILLALLLMLGGSSRRQIGSYSCRQ